MTKTRKRKGGGRKQKKKQAKWSFSESHQKNEFINFLYIYEIL